jgi:hypothetical protein
VFEVGGELAGGVGTEDRERGQQIGDLPDVGEGDRVDLSVIASQPAGSRALVTALVASQYQAQGKRVLERDPLKLPGQVQGDDGVPGLEGSLELGVDVSLGGQERIRA